MKKPKSRSKPMGKDRMQVLSASSEEVRIYLDGTTYTYRFNPPSVVKLVAFMQHVHARRRGQALNYLKRNAHHVLPDMDDPPRRLYDPVRDYASVHGHFGPSHPSAVAPAELNRQPNIKLTIVLPAELGHQFLTALDGRGGNIHDFVRLCAKARMRANKNYDVGDELAFGKYIGERIETVIANDPGYVNWLLQNTNSLILSDRLTNMLEESSGANIFHEIPF
jgi:hypothetical protein